MEGNRSALARFRHQCSVTKQAYHLLHYSCEVVSLSIVSLLCILDLGPNSKLPVRQGSIQSAAFSPASPCWRAEQGRAHPAALRFPLSFPLTPWHHVPPDGLLMDSSCLRLEPAKPSSRAQGPGAGRWQVFQPPDPLPCHNWCGFFVFLTVSVTVLLIYQKVWKFGMLFQFALFIYDNFVIVFYTFGVINYVNVKMSISKKSVKLWPEKKKPIRCIFKKESPSFMNHRYKLEIL